MDVSASTGSPASARDAAGAPDGAPDWETQHAEICCPMCEYNLRGLTEPRCPECGYRFEWKVLADAKARSHPYLFEHHPERNFKSFWQTAWGGLRPRKFWSTLHAGQRSRPGRLIIYWFAAILIASLAVAMVPFVVGCVTFASFQQMERAAIKNYLAGRVPANDPAVQSTLDQLWRRVRISSRRFSIAVPAWIFSCWLARWQCTPPGRGLRSAC